MIRPPLRAALRVAILTLPAIARADEPLTIERYVDIVTHAHPAGDQARATRATADAEKRAARSIADPTLTVGAAGATAAGVPGRRVTERNYAIEQVLPWPGARAAAIRAADRSADVADASAQALLREVELEARRAFHSLAHDRAAVDVLHDAEADARSLSDLVARRVEVGETREIDGIKARVEWLRQQRRVAEAERDAAAAEAVLRTLAIVPLPDPLALDEGAPGVARPLDIPVLAERLEENDLRLRAARATADRQEGLLALARRSRVPDLGVGVFRDEELDREATGATLSVRLPLWNASRGEIGRAGAALALARSDVAAERVRARVDLERRARDVDVASDRLRALDADILPAARESLRRARLSFEEGETSLLDLLDAQRTSREAELERVDVRLALALAVTELQPLVGGIDARRISP